MRRVTTLLSALVLLMAWGTGTAVADPAFTLTEHYSQTPVADDQNPCIQAFGEAMVNGVFHTTINDNGEHFTLTETGSLTGVDGQDRELIAHYTVWVGGNLNTQTGVFRFDLTLRAKGTVDGEPFQLNLTDHFNTKTGGTFRYNCHDGQGPQTINY